MLQPDTQVHPVNVYKYKHGDWLGSFSFNENLLLANIGQYAQHFPMDF